MSRQVAICPLKKASLFLVCKLLLFKYISHSSFFALSVFLISLHFQVYDVLFSKRVLSTLQQWKPSKGRKGILPHVFTTLALRVVPHILEHTDLLKID